MLLGALDRKLGFTEQLGSELEDFRDPSRVIHSIDELFRQRLYSIALGASDCNDAAHLRSDPALLIACGRSTSDGSNLASQPTLSRFEHRVTGRELVRLQNRIEAFAVKRLSKSRKLRKRITIDLDPSVDPTHGQQPFAYFNGFYDSWCYLPMFGFFSIEGEADQNLCHARLRAGTSKEAKGTPALLRRLVTQLRQRYPKAPICVRLDAGFAYPQILSCLEKLKVEYMVGMPENAVLARHSEEHMRAAENLTGKFGQKTTFFGESMYKAGSRNLNAA